MDLNEPIRLLLAAVIGAVIGFERESQRGSDEANSPGGIRTFTLISLLGAIAGIFFLKDIKILFVIICAIVFLLVAIYYYLSSVFTKQLGLTTEVAVIFSFLFGFLLQTNILSLQIVISLVVILLLVLSMKSKTQKIILGVSKNEWEAFVSYALIALVVLPFLPNQPFYFGNLPYLNILTDGYGLNFDKIINVEIFNPRKIWFIVALVTGIDVFGYLLTKLSGSKKGFVLTSFIAGFISSTSTTQTLAQKSQKVSVVNHLVSAAILANMASFFQVFLLVSPINSAWMISITPTLLIMIVSAGILGAWWYLAKEKKKKGEKEESLAGNASGSIFSLKPALKFALLLMIVKFVTRIALAVFGQSGFIISSIIASFAGIDAIVINLADMAGRTITFQTALLTFLLINATNLLSKIFYSSLQGSRKFMVKFSLSVIVIIALSFVGFFL